MGVTFPLLCQLLDFFFSDLAVVALLQLRLHLSPLYRSLRSFGAEDSRKVRYLARASISLQVDVLAVATAITTVLSPATVYSVRRLVAASHAHFDLRDGEGARFGQLIGTRPVTSLSILHELARQLPDLRVLGTPSDISQAVVDQRSGHPNRLTFLSGKRSDPLVDLE